MPKTYPIRAVLCYQTRPDLVDRLRSTAPDWEFVDAGQERVAKEILEADVFIGHAKVPIPWPEVVERGRLRWIQSTAAGMDHCLVTPVVASSIRVTSASGLFADAVAEQTLALLLGLLRQLATFFRAAARREFIRRPTWDLHGATVGIAGFGGNGQRIAQVLAPFGCRILATDLFPIEAPSYVEAVLPPERLPEILPQLDVLILAVPLTETTRGMIDRDALRRLPKGAWLINVARGPCVVEADLVEALESGHLAGAGLDVTETEPLPPESPLWELPQVLITPHVGAQSRDRFDKVTALACENIRRFRRGESLWNEVDKRLGFPLPQDRIPLSGELPW